VDESEKGHDSDHVAWGRGVGEVGGHGHGSEKHLACGVLGAGAAGDDADEGDVAWKDGVNLATSTPY
jgi:hypothetical protein